MSSLFQDAGIFIYPLLLCSLLAVVVVVERVFALRAGAVIPPALWRALLSGHEPKVPDNDHSVLAEIVRARLGGMDARGLRAFASWQVSRLERGLFLLDLVVGAAPLLGLLGTVTGLVGVFAGFDLSDGLPQTELFVQGIALALSTTVIGLTIALPSLVASSWLYRRVDTLAARIDLAIEQLLGESTPSSDES